MRRYEAWGFLRALSHSGVDTALDRAPLKIPLRSAIRSRRPASSREDNSAWVTPQRILHDRRQPIASTYMPPLAASKPSTGSASFVQVIMELLSRF